MDIMRVSNNISLKACGRIAALVTAAFMWHGCLADSNSMGPETIFTDDAGRATAFQPEAHSPEWYVTKTRTVKAGVPAVFNASRYKLIFDGDELAEDLAITVLEWHSDVIDVDFLPGDLFLANPVTLEIDYKGTANDPDSPNYNGMSHSMYWFNPGLGKWVKFEGTDNATTKKFTAELSHFSRYAMFDGTGGVLNPISARDRKTKDSMDDPARVGN